METVTQRVRNIKQPYGGYIRPKDFLVELFDDGIELYAEENISASLVGLAVDYLTRFMINGDVERAFDISLKGARNIDKVDNARKLLQNISIELDDKTVDSACKLCGYDICYRMTPMKYKAVETINPDANTIFNIRTMVNRSITFWKKYGPVVKDGFTMEGGYTNTIVSGDGDYLTADTLWDFKVSKNKLTSKQTLQLLVYYLMGTHSVHKEFKSIQQLGIYNPRLNEAYLLDISTIDSKVIEEVLSSVIGYGQKTDIEPVKQSKVVTKSTYSKGKNEWLIPDLVARYNVSRSKITSDFFGRGLPYNKVGRAYHFVPDDVIKWEMKQRYVPYGRNGRIALPAYVLYRRRLKKEIKKAIKDGDWQRAKALLKEAKYNHAFFYVFEDVVTITLTIFLLLLCFVMFFKIFSGLF